MPLAATHIIATTSLLSNLRSKYLESISTSKYFVFLAALGSLLPDIDIPLGWLLGSAGLVFKHGTVTHTFLFALFFLLISFLFDALRKENVSQAFLVLFLGIIVHLLLDYILGGGAKEGIAWLYPFSKETYKIHLLFLLPSNNTLEALDAIVLLSFFYLNSQSLLSIFQSKTLTKTE